MTESQLEKIRSTSVAIAGLGLGGSVFINLVRMGFEKFHITDPDVYERTNINRQRLAKETTINRRKDECLLTEAREINPDIQVKMFKEGVNAKNVSQFLDGMDWVVDAVDVFAIPDKLALNDEVHARKLPMITCGAIGFGAAIIKFDQSTASFSELSGMRKEYPYEENILKFIRFLIPEMPGYMQDQMVMAMRRKSHIPFVVPGVEISAALVTTEIAKHILELGKRPVAPWGVYVDPVNLELREFNCTERQ
jgi:molybdopterin/thiamine biosynthesis adenylyltransferase